MLLTRPLNAITRPRKRNVTCQLGVMGCAPMSGTTARWAGANSLRRVGQIRAAVGESL